MASEIYGFIANPVFALVFALIISALQIAGVIKMITARILLFIAWLIATVGVSTSLNNAPLSHRGIAALLVALPFGVILLLLERWITKTVNRQVEPSVTEKREAKQLSANELLEVKPQKQEPPKQDIKPKSHVVKSLAQKPKPETIKEEKPHVIFPPIDQNKFIIEFERDTPPYVETVNDRRVLRVRLTNNTGVTIHSIEVRCLSPDPMPNYNENYFYIIKASFYPRHIQLAHRESRLFGIAEQSISDPRKVTFINGLPPHDILPDYFRSLKFTFAAWGGVDRVIDETPKHDSLMVHQRFNLFIDDNNLLQLKPLGEVKHDYNYAPRKK
jgi:hypothetical protein